MKFINYINFLSVFLVSGLGIAQSFEWGGCGTRHACRS